MATLECLLLQLQNKVLLNRNVYVLVFQFSYKTIDMLQLTMSYHDNALCLSHKMFSMHPNNIGNSI